METDTSLITLLEALEPVVRALTEERRDEVEEAGAALRTADPAKALAATLRAAVLDEVGWPSFDDLVAMLGSHVQVLPRWPFAVLQAGPRILVLGPDGVVLDRRGLLPPGATLEDARIAGTEALLVYVLHDDDGCFRSAISDRRAVWTHRPDRAIGLTETSSYPAEGIPSYLDADGGVVAGGLRLRPGGRTAALHTTWTDGVGTWVFHNGALSAVDPETGEPVDGPDPALFRQAIAAGEAPIESLAWMTRAPGGQSGLFLGARDGILGSIPARGPEGCSTWTPDGARRAGCSVATLRWPGADSPVRLVPREGEHARRITSTLDDTVWGERDGVRALRWAARDRDLWHTLSSDGAKTQWAAGTPHLLPWPFASYFQPRDPEGSSALRQVDVACAARLLDPKLEPADAVHTWLPELRHPALRAGVAALVHEARWCAKAVATVRANFGPLRVVPRARLDAAAVHRALAFRVGASCSHLLGDADPAEHILRTRKEFAALQVDDLKDGARAIRWLARSPAWSEEVRANLQELVHSLHRVTGAPPLAPPLDAASIPALAADFAASTGLSVDEATLVIAGLARFERPPPIHWSLSLIKMWVPGPLDEGYGPAPEAPAVGIPKARAAEAHGALAWIPTEDWVEVWSAAGPLDDPSQAVAAMASTWNLRVGRRVDAPPGAVSEARAALDDPEVAWWLSALLDPTTLARRPRDTPSWSGLEPVAGLARAALWAHHLRPAGDALHEAVPTALRALRGQLRSWPAASFPILSAGRADELFDADIHALVAELGVPIVGWNTPGAGRSLVRYAGPQHGIAWVEIAPDLSADLPRLDVLAAALRSPRTMPWRHGLRALRWMMSAEADAFLEPCNLAFGQRAADPRASAPEAVARIAERYDLAEDAAATWLMMHVLPVCTDAALREVTGWPAATVAPAHKELLAKHLVVEDTRSRTRRRVFLPGPWADLAAPTAPQERARLDLLGVVFPEGERRPPLWPGLWAREPLGTLYARIAEI